VLGGRGPRSLGNFFQRDHSRSPNLRNATTINRDALCAAAQGKGHVGCAGAAAFEQVIWPVSVFTAGQPLTFVV
jgi:hypothetical protein